MTDINVDDFFKDVARTLVALYSVFPRRHGVFVDDIHAAEEPDEFGLYSDRYQACFGALVWLGDEGYLRYEDTISGEAIDQAVLTGRCFTVLSSPTEPLVGVVGVDGSGAENEGALPDAVRLEHATHIHQIKLALKHRSSTELRQAMIAVMAKMSL
ncbi:MAG: hypothetical protein AAGE43_18790 [Pseudomonadota bacterium]